MKTWEHSEKVQAVLQEVINEERDSEGFVTAFIAVCEVMDGDGKKLVAYRGPSAEASPTWLVKGMVREVIEDSEWFTDKEDE